MRSVLGWIARIVGLAALCFAMFDVPSAYAASRGWSPWLALALGAVSFPLLPLAWHAFGERKRRAGGTTTGWDRLLFRTLVVAVLAIGGVFAAARGQMWRTMRTNALWFVPDHTAPLVADSPLFKYIPPTAYELVWLRPSPELRAQLVEAVPDLADIIGKALTPAEVVLAIGHHDEGFLLAERGSADVAELMQDLLADAARLGAPDTVNLKVTTNGDNRYMASPGWASEVGTGRPQALLDLIPRVPDDAFAIALAKQLTALGHEVDAVGYIRVRKLQLELSVDLDAADPAAARAIATTLQGLLDRELGDQPAIAPCLQASGEHHSIDADGTTVQLRASVALDQLRTLAECIGAT